MKPKTDGAPARAFSFIDINGRQAKPRERGLTEIRGPYYSPVGKGYLSDLLDAMGWYVDSLKFAGGSFVLMPERELRDVIELCHSRSVQVSTGGFVERVLLHGAAAVDRYLGECRDVGFDIVEISSGFVTMPPDDMSRLVERVQSLGLKAKPEVGIQFGAGGSSSVEELESEGVRDPSSLIDLARRFISQGAFMVMIESEGITESVKRWRTDVPARIISALGAGKVMFEAADPQVFTWYVKNFGPDVNLFVDHSQIVQLECLRAGIWGTKSVWGRVVGYKAGDAR